MFVFLPAGACGLVRCGCCRRKAQGRADGTIIHVLRGNVKRTGTHAVWKYIKNAGTQTMRTGTAQPGKRPGKARRGRSPAAQHPQGTRPPPAKPRGGPEGPQPSRPAPAGNPSAPGEAPGRFGGAQPRRPAPGGNPSAPGEAPGGGLEGPQPNTRRDPVRPRQSPRGRFGEAAAQHPQGLCPPPAKLQGGPEGPQPSTRREPVLPRRSPGEVWRGRSPSVCQSYPAVMKRIEDARRGGSFSAPRKTFLTASSGREPRSGDQREAAKLKKVARRPLF